MRKVYWTGALAIACCLALPVSGCRPPLDEATTVVDLDSDVPEPHRIPPLLVSEIRDDPSVGQVSHVFALSSREPRTYVMQGVSCHCVSLEHAGAAVAKGQEIIIGPGSPQNCVVHARLEPSPATKLLTVRLVCKTASADAERELLLKLETRVIADLDCKPSSLVRTTSHTTTAVDSVPIEITYSSRLPAAKVVPSFSSTSPALTARNEPTNSDASRVEGLWQRSLKASVDIDPTAIPMDAGSLSAQVAVTVSGESRRAHAVIPVTLQLRDAIAAPAHASFGVVAIGSTRTKRLFVHSTDHQEFALTRPRVSTDSFRVTNIETAGDKTRYWVNVECTPTEEGMHSAEVVLDTSHSGAPQVKVHVDVKAIR